MLLNLKFIGLINNQAMNVIYCYYTKFQYIQKLIISSDFHSSIRARVFCIKTFCVFSQEALPQASESKRN
jgi:hypothetical protein